MKLAEPGAALELISATANERTQLLAGNKLLVEVKKAGTGGGPGPFADTVPCRKRSQVISRRQHWKWTGVKALIFPADLLSPATYGSHHVSCCSAAPPIAGPGDQYLSLDHEPPPDGDGTPMLIARRSLRLSPAAFTPTWEG